MMKLRKAMFGLAGSLFFDRPAQKKSLTELTEALEAGGQQLSQQFAITSDSEANRQQLRHIIGIERWGQRRLRVALGDPPTMDEFDLYQPPADSAWPQLQALFRVTRQETVRLAQALETTGAAQLPLVTHNDFGDLSIKGWLSYLNGHAKMEAKRVK